MEKTIQSKEFQNWMKCVSAQNETRKALCEVVENRWKGFISHLTEEERGQIETFLECVKSKNIKYLTKDLQEFCSHSACASILHKLLKLLKDSSVPGKDQSTSVQDKDQSTSVQDKDQSTSVQDKDQSTLVQDKDQSTSVQDKDQSTSVQDKGQFTLVQDNDQSTSVQEKDQLTLIPDKEYSSNISPPDPCYSVYWDIAKLYLRVEDGITKHDGLEELNVCHVVQMMIDCELFAFKGSTEAYKSICEDRNGLFRIGHYSFSNGKRQSVLEHMSKVLSLFNDEEFYTCTDVKKVIQENQNKDWTIEYEFEYKRIARQMLEIKLAALESDIQENEHLEDILEKTKTDLDEVIDIVLKEEAAEPRDEILETEKLKIRPQDEDKTELLSIEREQQFLEMGKEICLANLKAFLLHDSINISHRPYCIPQNSFSNEIKVTSFGNFQDMFVQIDGISVLFDPLDPSVIKGLYKSWHSDHTAVIREALHSLPLHALVLSTCINGFNATTAQKIVEKSPGIKWLIPKGIKGQLVEMGISKSSIVELDIWEEKLISFGSKDIKFGCIPTCIDRTLSHNTKCNSCSWIIKGSKRTFYSSGITNYNGSIFEDVAERYSPIHLAVLPARTLSCLSDYIATPNETVKMHRDIKAEISLGIIGDPWYRYSHRHFLKTELVMVDTSKFYLMKPGKTYRSDETDWDSD